MTALHDRADLTALSDRMSYLLALRAAIGVIVVASAAFRPESLGLALEAIAAVTIGYLVLAVVTDLARARMRTRPTGYALLTMILLLDGVYLAFAMYATGGTESPIRFLVYLHLVAVSLLASYRTGLKIALWHSLLLFVVIYAQAAQLVPAVDVVPGVAVEFDRMPVLNVTSFWLFALATSVFSAMNERELRQRRADLQALVDVGSRLDETSDPVRQAGIVLEGLVERFGFERGLILGSSDDRVLVLAAHNAGDVGTVAVEPDQVIRRAWQRRALLSVKRLDAASDPHLSAALPDARNLLVSPMLADGRPIGAVVVEHRSRTVPGVERRVASVLAQFASIAALNLRNAVLLEHVRDLAERDSLTGAANRHMFQSSLDRLFDPSRERSTTHPVNAVLFIDLDDFKIVNDSLGHVAGDALLVAVTDRISRLVRDGDMVARLGGDEFAILTDDEPDLRRSRSMAERLVHELRAPYMIHGHPVVVTASIGVAGARDAVDGAAELVRNADVAMYMAKANGKAGWEVFDPAMHAALRERHELGTALQHAAELDQLRLLYQPIVDLTSGVIAGLEALVRWEHPERGLIQPGQFIEIAEENGAILPIGHWVLREACRVTATWRRSGRVGADLFICVNVSAREIQQPGFVDGVRETLRETGTDARHLVLEITETALLRATPMTIGTLEELRELGVRTVIDDFGTGYFSLSHLRQFPVDALKIAGEFVADPEAGSRSAALAGAIVALSQSLGIETVAEGIESELQAERMRAVGCTYGQGFRFARPLSEADVLALVDQMRTSHAIRPVETSAAVGPRRASAAPAADLVVRTNPA